MGQVERTSVPSPLTDEPDAAGALAVDVARAAVAGEVVQRPLAQLELVGAAVGTGHGRELGAVDAVTGDGLGGGAGAAGQAVAQPSAQVGVPASSLVKA